MIALAHPNHQQDTLAEHGDCGPADEFHGQPMWTNPLSRFAGGCQSAAAGANWPAVVEVWEIMRSGGQILVEALRRNGAERVFTVPGESFLAALDALRDAAGVEVVVCRHEGGAAMMAEATARLGGRARPAAGVVFVSRGPGLANAMSGVHVAMQGGTALLLLVGLPPLATEGRGGFQETPVAALSGTFAKHAEVVRDAERIPEAIGRAIVLAHAGTPGPVVLGFPEDVLLRECDVADSAPVMIPEPGPTYDDMMRLADEIDRAEWPLVIVGGPGWTQETSHKLAAFAERLDLPVVASFRSQDTIDNRRSCYCGHAGFSPSPKLAAAIRAADLLLVIGSHLDEVTSDGYRTIAVPSPRQRIVHVHADAASIGRNHAAHFGVLSSPARFVAKLDDLCPSMRPGMTHRWSQLRRDLRSAFESWQKIPASPGALRLEEVARYLSATLPDDAIVTNGAGNYAAFLQRAFTYKGPGTQLAPVSGSMGYGLPAAIAAKFAYPDREVVCVAGDGCFQMSEQDLATAVQYALPIIIIIANNGMLGTIRAAQERRYPGRVVATSLVNPDFVALSRALGGDGMKVESQPEFETAIAQARAADRPFVIELMLDREAIAPGTTLSKLRNRSMD